MGKIIRLNTTFIGSNLPKLIDYDYAALEAEILAYPTLRAFYDADHVTKSGANVVQMDDRSGNGYHFVQVDTGKAPTASTINGVPSIYFDGTEEMRSTGLFSGNNEQSVASMLHAVGAISASANFMSSASSANDNYYLNAENIRGLAGQVQVAVTNVTGTLINYMLGANWSEDTSTIYGAGSSADGAVATAVPQSGDVNLGRWSDAQSGNKYIGHIGYVAVFDEDLSKDAYLRRLLDRYARSKFRTSTWVAG